jgi:hypothetical protein
VSQKSDSSNCAIRLTSSQRLVLSADKLSPSISLSYCLSHVSRSVQVIYGRFLLFSMLNCERSERSLSLFHNRLVYLSWALFPLSANLVPSLTFFPHAQDHIPSYYMVTVAGYSISLITLVAAFLIFTLNKYVRTKYGIGVNTNHFENLSQTKEPWTAQIQNHLSNLIGLICLTRLVQPFLIPTHHHLSFTTGLTHFSFPLLTLFLHLTRPPLCHRIIIFGRTASTINFLEQQRSASGSHSGIRPLPLPVLHRRLHSPKNNLHIQLFLSFILRCVLFHIKRVFFYTIDENFNIDNNHEQVEMVRIVLSLTLSSHQTLILTCSNLLSH